MNNPDNQAIENAENELIQKVTLDTILVTELGGFGKFQMKTVALAAIISIFASWGSAEYVFTTARINSRCVIPECDGPQPVWSPDWLANAIPTISTISFDNCKRFGNTSNLLNHVENNTCPNTLFDRNTSKPCEEFIYEHTDSVTYDFGLACDEWRRSLIGTIRTFGTLIGLSITGYVSDRWGRRIALVFSTFNSGLLGITRFWTNTYVGFVLLEFLEGAIASGNYSTIYILAGELMGPKHRLMCAVILDTFYSIGLISLGLIAWAVRNWRYLTLILYFPQLLTIVYLWLISESVRWYMSKDRFAESEALLKTIARTNGTSLPEKTLLLLRDTALEDKKNRLEEKRRCKETWLILKVLRHKQILLRCVVTPMWWITSTFVYYGLSINAVSLSGNKYLNFVTVAVCEIPGYWIAFFFLNKVGRKPVLIGGFWTCAACQIAYIFIPTNLYAISLTLYLIANLAIAMVVSSVYIYTMELYPTEARHSLFAYSSMLGRIGSMVAPLTPAFGTQWFKELPFMLFGSFALISGALVFLAPETLGSKLPDTFEEASRIGLKHNKSLTKQ